MELERHSQIWIKQQVSRTKTAAVAELDRLLSEAIGMQSIADVPVGAFCLGNDSSTVAAIMQAQSSKKIKTFAIGLRTEKFNEAEYAKSVAQALKTDHTEVYFSNTNVLDIIPNMSSMYDEPFGDSSALPTYLVSKVAREKVTVALSGDGGDELFGGYGRYFNPKADSVWFFISKLSPGQKIMLKKVLNFIQNYGLHKFLSVTFSNSRAKNFLQKVSNKLELTNNLLKCNTKNEYYRSMITHCHDTKNLAYISDNFDYSEIDSFFDSFSNPVEQKMAYDMLTYLVDDILCKVIEQQ